MRGHLFTVQLEQHIDRLQEKRQNTTMGNQSQRPKLLKLWKSELNINQKMYSQTNAPMVFFNQLPVYSFCSYWRALLFHIILLHGETTTKPFEKCLSKRFWWNGETLCLHTPLHCQMIKMLSVQSIALCHCFHILPNSNMHVPSDIKLLHSVIL